MTKTKEHCLASAARERASEEERRALNQQQRNNPTGDIDPSQVYLNWGLQPDFSSSLQWQQKIDKKKTERGNITNQESVDQQNDFNWLLTKATLETKEQSTQTETDPLYEKNLKIVENFDLIEKHWARRKRFNHTVKTLCIITLSSHLITLGLQLYYGRK